MEKPLQTSICRRMFARITFLLIACISMLVPNGSGSAQTYPNGKLIKLVSGAAPGSATDIVGRAVGEAFKVRCVAAPESASAAEIFQSPETAR